MHLKSFYQKRFSFIHRSPKSPLFPPAFPLDDSRGSGNDLGFSEIKMAGGRETYIPVVDFASFNSVNSEDFDESNVEIQKISQEIYDAFTTVGFVYIKNHGMPQTEVCT